MSEKERDLLRASCGLSLDGLALILTPIVVGASVGCFLGIALEWISSKIGVPPTVLIHQLLASGGGCMGLLVSIWFYRAHRASDADLASDLNAGYVQVIHVANAPAVEQKEYNDEGPTYFFDLGEGKILLLCGQWLFDPWVVSVGSGEKVPNQKLGFPSTDFTVHVCPKSRRVLKLEVGGQPITPISVVDPESVTVQLEDIRECAILQGNFDELGKRAFASALDS